MSFTKAQKKKFLKYGCGGVAILAACLLLSFGTLAPCSIAKKMALREMIDRLANDESLKKNPFGGLALGMVSGAVETTFEAMSPPRCVYSALRMSFGIENDKPDEPAKERSKNVANKDEKKPAAKSGDPVPADKLFGNVPKNDTEESDTDASKKETQGWQIDKNKSPIDDSETVILSLRANDPAGGGFRKYYPQLILRCKEKETDAFIAVEDMIRTERDSDFNEYAVATVRYDDEKASDKTFNVSPNNHAIFFHKAIGEIKKMAAAKQMIVRYTPYGDNNVTAFFNVEGLSDKIDLLKNACHWKDK